MKIFSLNRLCLFSVLTMCSLSIHENAFARNHWNRDYVKITYDSNRDFLNFTFEVFDYHFGPAWENGYLEYCNFEYSVDNGATYNIFMKASTRNQSRDTWTWVNMSERLVDAKLYFEYTPRKSNTQIFDYWADNTEPLIEINHGKSVKAWLTVKWNLGLTYSTITNIRVSGKWHANGIYKHDYFDEYYDENRKHYPNSNFSFPASKSEANTTVSKNDPVKVSSQDNAIVVDGTDPGDKIKVYDTDGKEINETTSNGDILKIKVPEKRMYFIHIGQKRYKVAM